MNTEPPPPADSRRLILWLWCRGCGDRKRLELPPDSSEGEIDSLSVCFLCDRCRAGRQAIAEGKVKPMDLPTQRRDGSGVMRQLHRAVRKAIEGR